MPCADEDEAGRVVADVEGVDAFADAGSAAVDDEAAEEAERTPIAVDAEEVVAAEVGEGTAKSTRTAA